MRRGNDSLQVMCRSAVSDKAEKGAFPVFVNKRKPFIDEQIKGGFETMNKNLKKVISAASALAVSASSIAAFAASYPDVATTADYYQAVNELSALGVIAGFEDGTFKPEENVTRAQITKMVVTALGKQVASAADAASGKDTQFTDVPGSHWAAGFVSVGTSSSAQNFINGYSATAFGPEDNVTYAQAIKMLVAALGYSSLAEGAGGWPSGYLKYGYSLGLTTGLSGIGNDQQLNRAQVAVLIDNALKCPICVSNGVTYNQFGQQVPVTLIKDGTGDLDDTKDGYQNLLNYAHDASLVYGRVTGTFKSGANVDIDEVRFKVEKSDNWDGYSLNAAKSDSADEVTAYKGQVTDADKYLFTYAEAIIQKDLNDEYTLVSITPFGASDIAELESSDYKLIKDSTKEYQLQMYKDAGRSKYDTYKISSDADIYVNGKEYLTKDSKGFTGFFDGKYVADNKVGKITLIDATEEGKSSTDGKYDYVMVSYYVDGVVDEVDAKSDKVTIYLDDCHNDITGGKIELDLDDEDKDYNITLDGEAIKAEDLQEDDVISVAYDVVDGFKDSDSYDIVVSRNTVEGKVSSVYTDANPLDNEYTLDNGEVYKVAFDGAADLTSGNSYTLYLDAFGKVVKAEDLASTKKYALLENVYLTNGNADAYVDVVTGEGSKVSYQIKTEDFDTFKKALMNDVDAFDTDAKLVNRKAPQNRVIEYTVTTKGELRLKDIAVGEDFNGEFKSSTGKIDSKQLTEAMSSIVNISDYEINKSQSYAALAYNGLTSGTTYEGYAFGKTGSNKVYQFVLITDGIGGFNVENDWAVYVQTTSIDTDNGDNDAIVAYVGGELKTLPTDLGSEADNLEPGDVFFYKLNSDSEIEEIRLVTTVGALGASYQSFYNKALEKNFDILDATTSAQFSDKVEDEGEFSRNENVDDTELIAGPIVDVSNGDVKIATPAELDREVHTIDRFQIDKAKDYALSDDANVYVYDYSVSKAKDRISKAGAGSVRKSSFDRSSYEENDKNTNIVNFKAEYDTTVANSKNTNYGGVNFAIAKIVDKEIAEILVIVPDSDDGM